MALTFVSGNCEACIYGGGGLGHTSYGVSSGTTTTFQMEEKKMSVVDRIKKLTLSSDDKLLQKYGLKDDDNDWTEEAVEVLDEILLNERKADLVAKAKELQAEDKANKK